MGRKALPVEPKNCECCAKPLERQRYKGQLEDRKAYAGRRFCGLTCSGAAHRTPTPSETVIRRRYTHLRGTICETCQTDQQIQLHHIDSNPENNAPDNLMTLCASCHARWHWEHGKTSSVVKATHCVVCGKAERWRIKRGMCQLHYQRWKKHGDPQADRPPVR